jgi:methyl-accepting chemotaxis protein
MTLSIKARLAVVGLVSIALVAAVVVAVSLVFFRREIDNLYYQDFTSRIDGIEFEYADVDAVSAASDEVARLQSELLARLERRFEGSDDARALIFNGTGDLILWPDELGIEGGVADALLARAEPGTPFATTMDTQTGAYWFVVDYYEPWDWYTGYLVSEETRFSALGSFLLVVSAAAAGVGVVALLVYVLTLRVSLRPLGAVESALGCYSDGDLRTRISVRRRDEVGQIADGVNRFADRLTEIVRSIKSSSDVNVTIEERLGESSSHATELMQNITAATRDISQRVERLNELMASSSASVELIDAEMGKLSERIEEQFAAVTQSTASIEEMNGSLNNVAAITQSKRASSERLMQTARDGGAQLGRTMEAVQTLLARVDAISEFVSIIQNVASQTNLLAMNAAIEAAHAGDAGRGFAVVADEIRKLAEEASTNSSETTASIKEIVETVHEAASSGTETQHAFEEIEQEVQTVVNSLDEIAASAAELSTGSGEIMNAMQVLQDVSTDVKSGSSTVRTETKTVSQAIGDLNGLTDEVQRVSGDIAGQAESASGAIESVSLVASNLHEATERLKEQIEIFRTDGEETEQA